MAGVAKKRVWGRSRPTTQIATLLDNTEVEELINMTVCEENSNMHTTIELQYPEMISNDDLIKSLIQMKVPIHRYDSGEPSRERLIHLFKQHVIPKPQRDRHGIGQKRKHAGDLQMDAEECYDWESSELEPESRKRKLDAAETVVPAKRRSPPTSICMTFEQQPMETTPLATRRIHAVKLKRSGCEANVTKTITADSCHKPASPRIVQSVFQQELCPAIEGLRGSQTRKEQFRKQMVTWP